MECQVIECTCNRPSTDGFSGISVSDLGSSCPEINFTLAPVSGEILCQLVRPMKLLLRLVQPVDIVAMQSKYCARCWLSSIENEELIELNSQSSSNEKNIQNIKSKINKKIK
ncbi:hypothetical protein AVEN_194327-1 [Araneus ventricosus]|uniref:Uncharacterized protein n=1 Tax=Araneus ventricosus TaxID=182803 RepID=A0A4Y2MIU1_ARAVE|nr:hypothetical protein AVEN_194327-1 [Araneus ventricosus]